MHGVNPVSPLTYDPPPEPLATFELAVVGFAEVLQHIPLSVTPVKQLPAILPPDEAVVDVIADIAVVVTVARTVDVVNVTSLP